MNASNNPAETLVSFFIGSWIGVTFHDPVSIVGGILNFILPDSAIFDAAKKKKHPFMFADTGIPAFLQALTDMGAKTDRMKVVIAGGAQVLDQTGVFNIGQKNYHATKSLFSANKISIHYEDIGGIQARTLSLNLGSGASFINLPSRGETKI